MILVVYSDSIVTLRKRGKHSQASPAYAIAECENWHKPYKIAKKIKNFDDFVTCEFSKDEQPTAKLVEALALVRPTRVIFVLPAGLTVEASYQYAGDVLREAINAYPEVTSCQIAVSGFGSPQVVIESSLNLVSGATAIRDVTNASAALALRDFEHQYMAWRMSAVLAKLTKAHVGVDPTQFAMLHSVAVDSTAHELKPDLVATVSWGEESTELHNVLRLSSERSSLKNDVYREQASKFIAETPTDAIATGEVTQSTPSLAANRVLVDFALAYRSRACDRLMLLAAVGAIENPFLDTNVAHHDNSQFFESSRFGTAGLVEDPHIEVRLEFPISSLIDLGDPKLVELTTTMWNKQLCHTSRKTFKSTAHLLKVGGAQHVIPITSEAYFKMQMYCPHTQATTAMSKHCVQLTQLFGWEPQLFDVFDRAHAVSALGRLLEKRYVTSKANTVFLTELGAAIYWMSHVIYGKFLSTWALRQRAGVSNALAYITNEFAMFKSSTDEQLANCESELPKAWVRDKPWTLIVKTLKTTKQAYWKRGSDKRGVDLKFVVADGSVVPELVVSPNQSYAKQDELGRTVYNLCTTCSAIVAHRVFNESESLSHFVCPNCRERSAFYITPSI